MALDSTLSRGSGADSALKSVTESATSEQGSGGSDFYFVTADDLEHLTDYTALLFCQVKPGLMNETDLAKPNRIKCTKVDLEFPGFRCKHCGGNERGNYFPSSKETLTACTATLHKHLLSCTHTPARVKQALVVSKSRHKAQVMPKPAGSQSDFFCKLWDRIHDASFSGTDGGSQLQERLKRILRTSPLVKESVISVPNVVSYDEHTDHQALGQNSLSPHDWGVCLDLLRRPPTPDSPYILGEPPRIDIEPLPVNIRSATATTISPKGESHKKVNVKVSSKRKRSTRSDGDGRTRKFTRKDELLLVRGIMRYGQKWKQMWDEQPDLQHIKPSCLKDRARSRRFKSILERAQLDSSLLDRPDELCGPADSPEYFHDGEQSKPTPLAIQRETTQGKDVVTP
ncbi:hypothetical protein ACHAWF_007940 [Thalassiosira exigua]